MGRGCGGGACEPLQVVQKYENQRPKILPVDVCMYDVRRIMGYDEMGYKKTLPVDRPLVPPNSTSTSNSAKTYTKNTICLQSFGTI
jgi:hypothetical protein